MKKKVTKLAQLRQALKKAKAAVARIELNLLEAQKKIKHKCMWCNVYSMRKKSKIYIRSVPVDQPYGLSFSQETCAVIECPKCKRGTRYFLEEWKDQVGSLWTYADKAFVNEYPIEWLNKR